MKVQGDGAVCMCVYEWGNEWRKDGHCEGARVRKWGQVSQRAGDRVCAKDEE